MRIAVAGGTGLVGRLVVRAAERAGRTPVVLARSRGIDLLTGEGLDSALAGVHAVVDVTNVRAEDADTARRLFSSMTAHLLEAEARAGVAHHVLLSIVGIDRVEGNPHYAGKRAQEALVEEGPIAYTIQRTTQFHEFAGQMVGWMRRGDAALLPPLLMQPVAAADVADVLIELATAAPSERAPDLAGPETQDLIDMARRTLAVRGESVRLVPSWHATPLGIQAAGDVLLPGPGARIAPTTFDAWLEQQREAHR